MSSHMETKDEEDLEDYDEEEVEESTEKATRKELKKGSYVGIHSSGFRDFLVKPELLRAIGDCGFEHPSEVQHECIPQAILGMDMICQAKSGMGKTAVFVLAVLQQLEPDDDVVDTLVLCHTRELAYQICQEFGRFSTYLPDVRIGVVYGGMPINSHIKMLKDDAPHVVVGTPGRVLDLIKRGNLKLDKLKRFVMDECDRMLESLDMRRDVQEIFKHTPHEKQVLMFSATIPPEMRQVCRKFAQSPTEIFVDDEKELTLHGLQQHFVKLNESEKTRKLSEILDNLDFNQVVIFVKSVQRAKHLDRLLQECAFPSMSIYGGLNQTDRIKIYRKFKDFKCRILVSTDLFGRGVDIERVNIVINYDMPEDADMYLHRVGRAGRFGTKGLAVTFVSKPEEQEVLDEVQKRFEVKIGELPDNPKDIDSGTYMTA